MSRRIKSSSLAELLVDREPREPGAVVCEGTIVGRAVPWKAPTISVKYRKDGSPYRTTIRDRDYKAFEGWKATIARDAGLAMRRHRPYGGPVELRLVFYLRPARSTPDLSNMVKSTEDGLQGVVIHNDGQVRRSAAERVVSDTEAERVEFAVIAI